MISRAKNQPNPTYQSNSFEKPNKKLGIGFRKQNPNEKWVRRPKTLQLHRFFSNFEKHI